MQRRDILLLFACVALSALHASPACAEGLIDTLVQRFAQSDFEFVRARNNAPFVPLAWLTASTYDDTALRRADGSSTGVSSQQTSISEGVLVPIPLGRRDVFVIGEWLSWTHFNLAHA